MTENTQQRYAQVRQEYGNLLGKITEIESEKREHLVVIETLSKVEPERRCWRLVGGVLLEKRVDEVVPALQGQSQQMDALLETLYKRLKELEEELRKLEQELGVKKTEVKQPESGDKSSGVLVG